MAVPPQLSCDSLSVSALLAIDKICRQFEAELEAGRKPQIEDFLGETREPQRGQLRRELETIQREHGQKPERHVTLAQFVQHLVASGLMNEDQVQTVLDEQPPNQRPQSGDELAKLLHRQGRLTRFQAQAVYQGKTRGLVLGNYVLLDKLGRGGMGQVFRAMHRRMGRVVALKMLPPKDMRSQDAVKRFRREVKAAARLSHANIVATHDAGEADGIHFLVMECVEGQDLASLVKQQGPLDVAAAVDYVVQAAQGLDYAHRQGVVHRDIKPANILIDEQDTIKVLDMGLARVETPTEGEQSLTHTGQVMGTLDYMSPEQALDTRHVDGRTDIYSLGCTLYYLLAGRPPYGGDTMTKKILAHREHPIPSLCEARPEVPEALEVIFAQMLAKDFEQRQASMAEVIGQLNAVRAELSNVPAPAAGTEPALAETVSITAEPVPSTSTSRASDVRVRSRALTPREPAEMWRDFLRVIRQGYKWLTQRLARQSSEPTPAAGSEPRIPRVPLLIGLGVLGVAGLFLGIVFLLRDGHRTVRVEIDPALINDATLSVWMDGRQMEIAGIGETIRLKPGEHGYEIRRGDEIIAAREFTVLKDDNPALQITMETDREDGGSQAPGATDRDYRTLSDLARRIIELWKQKALFGPLDDTCGEDVGSFGPDDQSAYVQITAFDEFKKSAPELFQSVEEVRLGPETPLCKTIGPIGLIRWDNRLEIRREGSWRPGPTGLAFAVRRNGRWKVISAMEGNWRLSPSDRYDPENENHLALQRLLERVSEALVRKETHTTRDLFHSEYYCIFPDPAQPEQAFVSHGAEDRQAGEEMMQHVTFDDYRHTVTFVKVQGPLAVTISRRERTIGGQTATAQDVNFYGRTEKGWQAIISAEGDWTDLLMAEPNPRVESVDTPPAVLDLSSGTTDIPDLCRRLRRALVAGDRAALDQLVYKDAFVGLCNNVTLDNYEDLVTKFQNCVWSQGPTLSIPDKPPVFEIQGTTALVHLAAYQSLDDPSRVVNMLAVAAKQDGQWRVAGMLFGRWFFGSNDVFEVNNTTHSEVQGVLDRIAQAADRKDAELLRPIYHPHYRLVGAVPDQPEAAVLFSAEDVLQNVAKGWKTAGTIRYRDRIKEIHVREGVALAQAERWFEMDGRASHSFLLFLFCHTNTGWKQALEVTGDWRRFLTEETGGDANTPESRPSTEAEFDSAKDIPDLCHRIRDAWAQRDFSPSRNLAWPDCFMVAGTDPQSHELLIMNSSDGTEALDAFLRSVDEVVPSTDQPVYEVQGPLAIMRWKKARLRMGENWHTVEGLDVAVERDGLWRCAVGIDGDWKMTPEDRYDPSNDDHVALQELLEQAGEAMVRKDARTFRELLHSEHRSVFAGPDGAQVMGINGYTDELLQELAHEKHQPTITAVKVTGPLAVTLSQLDWAVHGQAFTQQGILNICGRTNDGWRQLMFVAGDWRNVLMAESER